MEPGEFRGTIRDDSRVRSRGGPSVGARPRARPTSCSSCSTTSGSPSSGCFGSDIDTPTLDRLAGAGLQFTNFHTTALCSPTRSCLLTGRNHHRNGMGRVMEMATGFPGVRRHGSPRANGFLSQMLVDPGYAT